MSNTIEQRIVGIEFENKQFENGVKDSLGSLDKLKKGLDLEGAGRGLSEITAASNKFSLAGMAAGIEAIATKFSNLSIMGITTLANLTNSAVNFGKQLISSLTIDPVRAGFKEYEEGLSAFQTIQANTAGATAKVSQKALNAIKNEAVVASQASLAGQAASLAGVQKSQTQQTRAYQKTADSQLKILADTQEKASTALSAAMARENKTLQIAHNAKLALYNSEYMEKLKVIDEERYNQIKAIDKQIDSINGLTDAEEAELKKAEELKKLKDLETDVKTSKTLSARKKAEETLAEYRDKLTRDQILKDRQTQIDGLQTDKNAINTEYDLKTQNLSNEYTKKTQQEKEIYALTSENIQTAQSERLKALRDSQKLATDNLREQQSDIRNAMSDSHSAAMSGMQTQQKTALENIEEQKNAKISALQKVAAATKIITTEEDINKALADLNDYANKTVYSFGDMNKAVGNWTAKGAGLNESVSGIKGLYNLVSMVGSTATQAQGAITQLGQKISGGTVMAIDWMSAENAGIAGGLAKQATIVAKNQGVAIDELMAKYGSFRATLEAGWFTSDILLESLKQFAGEYNDEQLRSMGYNEEQITQIQELARVSFESATVLKSYSQTMDMLKSNMGTGWATTFKLLIGNLGEAKELWTKVGTSIGGAMQASTDARNGMLRDWNEMGGRKILIQGLINVFDALTSIIKPIKDAFREFFPKKTGNDLFLLTIGFRNFTEKLKMGEETAAKYKQLLQGIFSVIKGGKDILIPIIESLKPLLGVLASVGGGLMSLSESVTTWVLAMVNSAQTSGTWTKAIESLAGFIEVVSLRIKSAIGPIEDFAKKIGEVFTKIWNVIKIVGAFIVKGVTLVFDKLKDEFKSFDKFDAIRLAEGGGLVAIAVAVTKLFKVLTGIGKSSKKLVESISEVLDGVKGALNAFALDLKASALLKVAFAIGILALAMLAMTLVDPTKLEVVAIAMVSMVASLIAALKAIGGKDAGKATVGSLALIGIATSLLILSKALLAVSELNWDQIAKGMTALILMAGLLIIVAKGMANAENDMLKMSASFILFSVGLSQLAKGLKLMIGVIALLGEMEEGKLKQGLIALGALLAGLLLFIRFSKFEKMGISAGLGMIGFAFGLKLLYETVYLFSEMDQTKLTQGLLAVGSILGSIAVLTSTTSGKDVLGTAAGLVVIAGAMFLFIKIIEILGNMPIDKLAIGWGAMALTLAAVAAAVAYMPKDALLKAGAIVAVAAALVVISEAIKIMGNIPWPQLLIGLGGMAAALLIMVGAIKLMSDPKSLMGATSMVIMAGALLVLAQVLKMLATIPLEQMAIAVGAMAAVFLILGVAAKLIGLSGVAILNGLALAIALIGGAAMLAGLGLYLFALALGALAVAGAAGGAVLIGILVGLIAMIPLFMAAFAAGIVAFVVVLAANAPVLEQAFIKLFTMLLNVINAMIPPTMVTFLLWLDAILNTLTAAVPKLLAAGYKILLSVLKGIRDNIGEITDVVVSIILNFINALSARIGDIIDAGYNFLINFLNGLADAIRNNYKRFYDAAWNILTALVEAFAGIGHKINEIGMNIINGIVKGLKDYAYKLRDAAKDVFGDMLGAVMKFLDIDSPSKVFAEIGKYSMLGVAVGLNNFGGQAIDAATGVGEDVVGSLSNAMSGIPELIDGNIDMSPKIRPVIDLTGVQSGASAMDSMLNKDKSISVETTMSKADEAAKSQTMQNQLVNDIKQGMTDLRDSVTSAFDKLVEPIPQINFNGTYSFAGQDDIDYFMNAAALLVQRRKG